MVSLLRPLLGEFLKLTEQPLSFFLLPHGNNKRLGVIPYLDIWTLEPFQVQLLIDDAMLDPDCHKLKVIQE